MILNVEQRLALLKDAIRICSVNGLRGCAVREVQNTYLQLLTLIEAGIATDIELEDAFKTYDSMENHSLNLGKI